MQKAYFPITFNYSTLGKEFKRQIKVIKISKNFKIFTFF